MNARVALLAMPLAAAVALAQNHYTNTVLVANSPDYTPLVMVDPLLVNGWGVTLRPPGAGGHFWISNAGTGTTTTYVGDVHTPAGFVPLFQDALTVVDIPIGTATLPDGRPVSPISIPTGQVYNYSTTDFVVSGEGITNASKFIFVTGDGTISGWTEWRDAQNVLHRQTRSVITVDTSAQFDDERLVYTGVAVTEFPSNNRLYAANWTAQRVEVYDNHWQRIALPAGRFSLPSVGEDWRPWNIQVLRTGPQGEGRVWVTFNKAEDPWEEYPDFGAVAEFDLDGNLIRTLTQTLDTNPLAESELRDPWGLAIAPADFGPFSGMLLVANFGDGTIPAFDLTTGRFVDFLRDDAGEPIVVDGIWGITFGNGVALGDSNALYYAAGPNGEEDGTFGTVRFTPSTCPVIKTQPVGAVTCPGGSATFAYAAPSPVFNTSHWQVRGTDGSWSDLIDGLNPGLGNVSGAMNASLTISGVQGAALLRAVLSNACGSASTAEVQLEMTPATQPPCISSCDADLNQDGNADQGDVDTLINVIAGGENPGSTDPDFNRDGNADQGDIDALITVIAGGPCPG